MEVKAQNLVHLETLLFEEASLGPDSMEFEQFVHNVLSLRSSNGLTVHDVLSSRSLMSSNNKNIMERVGSIEHKIFGRDNISRPHADKVDCSLIEIGEQCQKIKATVNEARELATSAVYSGAGEA